MKTEKPKKTEYISLRLTADTKDILQQEANKLDWTVSKLAERILREWTEGAKKNSAGAIQFIISHNENINIK